MQGQEVKIGEHYMFEYGVRKSGSKYSSYLCRVVRVNEERVPNYRVVFTRDNGTKYNKRSKEFR